MPPDLDTFSRSEHISNTLRSTRLSSECKTLLHSPHSTALRCGCLAQFPSPLVLRHPASRFSDAVVCCAQLAETAASETASARIARSPLHPSLPPPRSSRSSRYAASGSMIGCLPVARPTSWSSLGPAPHGYNDPSRPPSRYPTLHLPFAPSCFHHPSWQPCSRPAISARRRGSLNLHYD
jgi:hypothetical protein